MIKCFISTVFCIFLVSSANAQSLRSTLEPGDDLELSVASVVDFKKALANSESGNTATVNAPQDLASMGNMSLDEVKASLNLTTTQGQAVIKNVRTTPTGETQVIVSLVDEDSGEPLEILSGDFKLSETLTGTPVSFTAQPYPEAKIPGTIISLMDASGSMAGSIDDVVNAANFFFDQLPEHFTCHGIVFSDNTRVFGGVGNPCNANGIGLSGVESGGGTNLLTALKEALELLHAQSDAEQKAIMVLTDGQPSDFSADAMSELATLKGDAEIIFFWLSASDPEAAKTMFQPIADHFVSDQAGAWRYLEEYYAVYTDRLNKQTVLTLN